jgi:hypothetical protein
MSIYEGRGQGNNLAKLASKFKLKRGTAFGIIILTALLAFELFNYSTTEYALGDLLGSLTFAGIRWATILSIAFCGIDFAGIARLFTPDQGTNGPTEVWYLFGAWLLAATMNAILTWWGVSMAVVNHQLQSTSVIDPGTVMKIVPVFVAIMVWLIRILIIGSLSYAGDRLFSSSDRPRTYNNRQPAIRNLAGAGAISPQPQPGAAMQQAASMMSRPAPKSMPHTESNFTRSEPTYQSLSMTPGRGSGASTLREPTSPDTRR